VKLSIAAIGRLRPGPEQDLLDTYLGRLRATGRQAGLADVELVEKQESRRKNAAERKVHEAAVLRDVLPAGARLIALDERGRDMGSRDFAARIGRWRDQGTGTLGFVLGGPDGLDAGLRDEAELVVSLGRMTWPHMLARVMLAEQLYRSFAILTNHPYHRE
jgi:23S rRNA (pseudouridine1915-N3)-methyltransferase